MSGRHKFRELRDQMSPESRERVARKVEVMRMEMTLAELRKARALTQENLSETLHVGQTAVAKMEKRTDMYVGNLRRFVEAMGGELDIVARFPEGAVKISNFAAIGHAGVAGPGPE